jgi:hypothetical protein
MLLVQLGINGGSSNFCKISKHHSYYYKSLIVLAIAWLPILINGAVVWAIAFHFSRYGLMWKESVNVLPKVVGFLQVLQFPLTGKLDKGGLRQT